MLCATDLCMSPCARWGMRAEEKGREHGRGAHPAGSKNPLVTSGAADRVSLLLAMLQRLWLWAHGVAERRRCRRSCSQPVDACLSRMMAAKAERAPAGRRSRLVSSWGCCQSCRARGSTGQSSCPQVVPSGLLRLRLFLVHRARSPRRRSGKPIRDQLARRLQGSDGRPQPEARSLSVDRFAASLVGGDGLIHSFGVWKTGLFMYPTKSCFLARAPNRGLWSRSSPTLVTVRPDNRGRVKREVLGEREDLFFDGLIEPGSIPC